jgi:chorismate mutase
MSVEQTVNEERPCLHCAFVDLIDEFFAEYKAESGEAEINTDEVLEAIAKTVAEFTYGQVGTVRQQIVEQLMRQIMDYDTEFRRENEAGSLRRH